MVTASFTHIIIYLIPVLAELKSTRCPPGAKGELCISVGFEVTTARSLWLLMAQGFPLRTVSSRYEVVGGGLDPDSHHRAVATQPLAATSNEFFRPRMRAKLCLLVWNMAFICFPFITWRTSSAR